MALPKLQDYLPPEPDLRQVSGAGAELVQLEAALEIQEQLWVEIEQKLTALERSIDHYLEDLEGLPELTDTEVGTALADLAQGEARYLPVLREYLRRAEAHREGFLRFPDTPLKGRAVALVDRESKKLLSAVSAWEKGKRRVLLLRDHSLVREAQQMSSHTFWAEE